MHELRTEIITRTEILIVEDSPTQAAQLEHHLIGQGYPVTIARNGREALVRLLQESRRLLSLTW